MRILDIISVVLGIVMAMYGMFYGVTALFGLKKRKSDFAVTKPVKKIAAIIAARNEENVIGQIVESLMKQEYPKELFDVIVVPNNCTDDTAGAAERLGAKIIMPDCEVHSKGAALQSAFRQIFDAGEAYDAFAIFDADNIVHPGFLQAANDALNGGARIAQGVRDSKNASDNWVSGASSIFYWFMNRLYNHARRVLGSSAALNGTGFVVSTELLRETGFNTHTLTEDLEFTAQCAIRGERIYWMDDAITYDEQPTGLFDALRQRRRWMGGAWQCKKYYMKDLLKKHSLICVDMALIFGGLYFMFVGALPLVISACSMLIYAVRDPKLIVELIVKLAVSGIGTIVLIQAFAALVCLLEKKSLRKTWSGIVFFPLFAILWLVANWSCIFANPTEWKPIKHKTSEKLPMDS